MKAQDRGKQIKENKILTVTLTCVVILMLGLTVYGLIVFNSQVKNFQSLKNEQETYYDRHYVLIYGDTDDTYWNTVFERIRAYGAEKNVLVEKADNIISGSYTKEEYLELYTNAGVDGIIVEGDTSGETLELINIAEEKGIPVVTVSTDSPHSNRSSFVGISNYNVGVEYAKLILTAAKEINSADPKKKEIGVTVLLDKAANTYQNIIYNAILENVEKTKDLNISFNTATTDNLTTFSNEESIRDLFRVGDSLPDIIVCLNELNTKSVYQMLVDSYRVGEAELIGYYASESILRSIERGSVYATITIDIDQMAKYCVDALNEYYSTGRVSEYYGVDYRLITAENVGEYLK